MDFKVLKLVRLCIEMRPYNDAILYSSFTISKFGLLIRLIYAICLFRLNLIVKSVSESTGQLAGVKRTSSKNKVYLHLS